jgi:hypothetical protein
MEMLVLLSYAAVGAGLKGYYVQFLNATVPNSINCTNIDNGCADHPSAMQQLLTFERARSTIVAAALNW